MPVQPRTDRQEEINRDPDVIIELRRSSWADEDQGDQHDDAHSPRGKWFYAREPRNVEGGGTDTMAGVLAPKRLRLVQD